VIHTRFVGLECARARTHVLWPMDLLYSLDSYIMLAAWIAGIPVGAYALSMPPGPVRMRSPRRQVDQAAWLGITGGGLALLLICRGGPITLFWLIGLIAVLVYLVDVRPSLIEVQGGRR